MLLIEFVFGVYIVASILEMFLFKPGNTFDIYFGVPGCGKTTLAAWLARKALKRKKKVYCNVDIKGTYQVEKKDIGRYDISDGLLLLDEIGIDYDNRKKNNMSDEEVKFYKYHRHYNVDIAGFSQDFEDMDKKLRKLATRLFLVKKSAIPFCISRRTIRKKIDINKDTGEIIERYYFVKFSRRFFFAPLVWKMFNSHSREELPYKEFKLCE